MSGSCKHNASLPLDNDIVKQGYLYIKRPPRNGLLRLKSWHKRYFVLRDETMDHPSRLEMYQKESDFCKNNGRRFVLNLDKVVHVGRAEDSKRFRQAFMIVCSGRTPVMLAEDDHLYTNSWLLAVTLIAEKRHYNNDGMDSFIRHFNRMPFSNDYRRTPSGDFHDSFEDTSFNLCYSDSLLEESSCKRYDVTVEPTAISQRNGIEGNYELIVHSWRLSLARPGKEDYQVQWPLCFIRKFKTDQVPHAPKNKSTLVTFELGRRCATGEGIVKFRTQFGKEIIADMNQAVYQSMSHRSVMDGTSLFRSHSRSRPNGNNCCVTSGIWKPVSRDSSSSRGPSLSRQSSGGTNRSSRLMLDGSLQVVDLAGVLQNHGSTTTLSHQRSPLRSDSSGDSKTLSDHIPHSRASVSSQLSSSSSSTHSSQSASSNESAEYIQARFSSPTLLCSCTHAKEPCKCASSNRSQFVLFSGKHYQPDHGENTNQDIASLMDERAAKAAAEGYLEVLPDIGLSSSEGKNEVGVDSDDFSSIYHVMDFSKRTSLSSLNHSRICSSATSSSSNRSDYERKKHHHPKSPIAELTDHDGHSDASSSRKANNTKPPAPLPRPVHTITS